MDKILERIYLFLISRDFPLWLALIYIIGFTLDLTSTFQVLYTDKSLFLAKESNEFLKYAFANQKWYIYSLYVIAYYGAFILISKKVYHPFIRLAILNHATIQVMAPLAWFSTLSIFLILNLSFLSMLLIATLKFLPKKVRIKETFNSNASLVP